VDAGLESSAVRRHVRRLPHLLDRCKPGIIGVLRNDRRFINEANSYHDVGAAMIEACQGQQETAMRLICDQATIGKYGLVMTLTA
jgi:FAD binding domain-containing protein